MVMTKRPEGYLKPEWRRKLQTEPPPRTEGEAVARREESQRAAAPWWLKVFEMWRPSPEELEERQTRRTVPLTEAIVPPSEREYVAKQMEEARRGGFRAEEPGYRRGYEPRREARAAGPYDPLSAFDLPKMWEGIRTVRKDPRFKGTFGVGQLSPAGRGEADRTVDVARFFRIPEDVMRQHRPENAWRSLILPLLGEVERLLAGEKPRDIGGILKFDFASNGAFGLVYREGP
jgi:hypothetical protein